MGREMPPPAKIALFRRVSGSPSNTCILGSIRVCHLDLFVRFAGLMPQIQRTGSGADVHPKSARNVELDPSVCERDEIFNTDTETEMLRPDLQNILRESYDYRTIGLMPKLRSTYDGRLIFKTSYEGLKAFLRYDPFAKRKIV